MCARVNLTKNTLQAILKEGICKSEYYLKMNEDFIVCT